MVDKKGQIKIQQMIFMIIAVTLLFTIVALFFLSISLRNLTRTANELQEEDSMLLVSKLANSPEFSCGDSFGTTRTNCIDFDKLIVLWENSEKYQDFWGVPKIEIRKVYPPSNITCSLENYPDCGIIKIVNKDVNSLAASSNFVSLCRKEEEGDVCELARIMVSSEVKG